MKMKQLLITTASIIILTSTAAKVQAQAGSTTVTTPTGEEHIWNDPGHWWNERFYYDKDTDHRPLFSANELTLDFFGTYLNPERRFTSFPNTSIHKGHWGGGVGANYFWSKDVGIGADTSFQVGASDFVDHVGGNLIVRFPIDVIRLAPYVFAGGGRKFDPIDQWFGDAGAGLEFRLNRNLGISATHAISGMTRQSLTGPGMRLCFEPGCAWPSEQIIIRSMSAGSHLPALCFGN